MAPEVSFKTPLEFPTVQERIRAFYLERGFNRASFARALGVGYTVVANWESKTNPYQPSIPNIRQAAIVLQVTTDDLIFGAEPRPVQMAPHPRLPVQGQGAGAYSLDLGTLRIALDRAGASALAREALVTHMESPRGQLQRVTVDYALAYVHAWDAAMQAGRDEGAANRAATHAAINARAESHARADLTARASSKRDRSHATTPDKAKRGLLPAHPPRKTPPRRSRSL